MPPPISDRYKLEMRIGRDGDLEEWLATDVSLERPVLIRSLGPDSSPSRRDEFVSSVSAAAKASHSHLARIFAVERVEGGAYSVSEWAGGATVADRVAAGRVMDLTEFLPNAAGLAGALASLHESGAIHGHIDPSAVAYSVAHPAKLIGFGRPAIGDMNGDVRALSRVLETAVTGLEPGGPPPSESIDGFPRRLDRILRQGQSGQLTAADLSKLLLGTPTPRPPKPEAASTSRRVLIVAAALVLIAVGLIALGRVFSTDGQITPPVTTDQPSATPPPPSTSTTVVVGIEVIEAGSYDPFGEGGENDTTVVNLIDGNNRTVWQTERYQDPLPEVKPGVGVRVEVEGVPASVTLIGLTPGTDFELAWAERVMSDVEEWDRIVRGVAPEGRATFNLPPRDGGNWLIWMTDLPEQQDGTYYASLSEVRFSP